MGFWGTPRVLLYNSIKKCLLLLDKRKKTFDLSGCNKSATQSCHGALNFNYLRETDGFLFSENRQIGDYSDRQTNTLINSIHFRALPALNTTGDWRGSRSQELDREMNKQASDRTTVNQWLLNNILDEPGVVDFSSGQWVSVWFSPLSALWGWGRMRSALQEYTRTRLASSPASASGCETWRDLKEANAQNWNWAPDFCVYFLCCFCCL